MSHIIKKVKTAKRILQTRGVQGIVSVLLKDIPHQWEWSSWWFGKIVEIKGNIILIDGCHFSVCSPAITTAFKSRFYFDEYETSEREALKRFLDPNFL